MGERDKERQTDRQTHTHTHREREGGESRERYEFCCRERAAVIWKEY